MINMTQIAAAEIAEGDFLLYADPRSLIISKVIRNQVCEIFRDANAITVHDVAIFSNGEILDMGEFTYRYSHDLPLNIAWA